MLQAGSLSGDCTALAICIGSTCSCTNRPVHNPWICSVFPLYGAWNSIFFGNQCLKLYHFTESIEGNEELNKTLQFDGLFRIALNKDILCVHGDADYFPHRVCYTVDDPDAIDDEDADADLDNDGHGDEKEMPYLHTGYFPLS